MRSAFRGTCGCTSCLLRAVTRVCGRQACGREHQHARAGALQQVDDVLRHAFAWGRLHG